MKKNRLYIFTLVICVVIIAGYFVRTEIRNKRKLLGIDLSLYTQEDREPQMTWDSMLMSQICTESQLDSKIFQDIAIELGDANPSKKHRKLWEFVYIVKALKERGLVSPGKRGVGVGVGQEPLPSYFAKNYVSVIATDYGLEQAQKDGWADTKQHLSSKQLLNIVGLAPQEQFERLVEIREVDMNNIPQDLRGFDFTWSSCALEHLGSIEKGLQFIINSLDTLKPGGIAVHTTEYNLSSNEDTLDNMGTVLFRKKDIQELVRRLTLAGHEIYINYNPGSGKLDKYIDIAPYSQDKHLKLRLANYVTTSIGFIIRKKEN